MSSLIIEEEHGTTLHPGASLHPHNGYSGGEFHSPLDPDQLTRWFSWGRAESARLREPLG